MQIKFEFNAVEDRLLLRISVPGQHESCEEYRFWLTRRFVGMFIKGLEKVIEDALKKDMQVSPDARESMKKFQHEAALAKADFSTTFNAGDENCTFFGETPLLVTTLKITRESKGKHVLLLLDKGKKGIHLTADIDLMHTLQKMLIDSAQKAGWDLALPRRINGELETIRPARYVS